ncbi:hypothetical protein [Roseitranquillus sediminis]|uniref:hypothetical protein n=1 Tax=Roseitranquillus sediminis TaxID=2809051 RepID=UPI001D0C4DF5|nr:hypothetical protein [Roseitranquillus sediminis]MBM9596264.1 hypothetical protein [Roseitranquillus sediminis]
MGFGAFEQGLIIWAVVVLVSLVPAWILYRILPSTSVVTGPFKGFDLNLTGAFAGYFIIMIFGASILMFYVKPRTVDLGTRYWVRGEATLGDGTRLADGDQLRLGLILIPLRRTRQLMPDNVINWELEVAAPTDDSGAPVWPFEGVNIAFPNYWPEDVRFNDLEREQGSANFVLKERIVLEPK